MTYQQGQIICTAQGQVKIMEKLEDRNGLETYKVVTGGVKLIGGRPVNVFIAQVVPTLMITGPDPDLAIDSQGECQICQLPLFETTEGITCPNGHGGAHTT